MKCPGPERIHCAVVPAAGTREAFPDYTKFIGAERIEEAESISVEAIVSGCPYCKENFLKAGQSAQKEMKAYDLSELILMALK